MRVAVVGQGSIGRRHAEGALALGHEALVYDPDPRAQPPAGARRLASVEECLQGADAAVIASPSSMHPGHARAAIEQGVPAMVEKPLALDQAGAAELDWLARTRGVLLSVAMSMREHPGVQALRSLLADGYAGEALGARAWCGSYLPGWHPGSDYRDGYSARRALGGGVLLDVAVHELDYLLWLLGPARSVSALLSGASELQTDVEELAAIALELDSGALVEVSADYLDRSYSRGCRIVGSKGTLRWSWHEQSVVAYDVIGETAWREAPNHLDGVYRAELERFLAAVAGDGPAPVSAAEAQDVLAAIDAARLSSAEGRHVAPLARVQLRPARREDAELLLAWRNDPQTRQWSLQQREIGLDEHERWLERVLADTAVRLWLIEEQGGAAGQVRVCADGDGVGEVHVGLAPEARGRGLGAAALVQGCARALAELGLSGLYAQVKAGNEASLRAFARAGFERVGEGLDGTVRLERPVTGPEGAPHLKRSASGG